MSKSILVDLARHSIEEVLEAKRIINVLEMIEQYPTLANSYASFVNLYIDSELQGSYGSLFPHKTLIEDIIYNAKFAAFEDSNIDPITTSKYLHSAIEVSILSDFEEIKFESYETLLSALEMGLHGLTLVNEERTETLMPTHWQSCSNKESFVDKLLNSMQLDPERLDRSMKFYKYTLQSARDTPILNS